ncbi:amylo-alpha-1,6-glucosidase [Methanolobus sp. ZRKC3]|uniref:amylo-alpha-1,6-glucosidase n=1 Tax=Methanolobus sp. ZRKC3 TaxID=3125786 RepID=UPI00324A8878
MNPPYNDTENQREWIISNGLGGYASSTPSGLNTRKYHGLLIAAMNPPVERMLLLSSLDEEIIIDTKIHHLAVHKYPGKLYPEGYKYLQDFSMKELPVFQYNVNDIEIRKSITMIHGENSTVIQYNISNPSNTEFSFKVLPLINNRSIHHLTTSDTMVFEQEARDNDVRLSSGNGQFQLYSNMQYRPEAYWYYDLEYDVERDRGYPYRENNLNPGYFQMHCKENELSFFIIASTGNKGELNNTDIKKIFENELLRREEVVASAHIDDLFYRKLLLAGDSFIVDRKTTGAKSIIAGYHWFADWGRDAMIALPGLTLVNGRFDIAGEILSTFASHCQRGLIPNMFPEFPGQTPVYNTVDASLWFIHALGKYFDYTNDTKFLEKVWDTVEDIINHYISGTDYNIGMDEDGLISHGGQLTWMDAKIGDFEVTPRKGKTCEINALWYNALRYAEYMGDKIGRDNSRFNGIAETTRSSFIEKFWNEKDGFLYDCILDSGEAGDRNNENKDASIRPNQILAVSLPFSMLPESVSLSIVEMVGKKLLTPYGLRTLSPEDTRYIGTYHGNTENRDMAYHNGTVWTWLLGHYITAYRKTHPDSQECRESLEKLLVELRIHIDEAGLGSISEIFDGDAPHKPRGCISQAWSVAELTRAYAEDVLQASNIPIRNLYDS